VKLGQQIFAGYDHGCRARGSDACKTSRFSVLLILSRRNMASMYARKPMRRPMKEQLQSFGYHAILE
jgi:hypothetical protein